MPGSYVKIQSVTVGSGGAANIEFTSIPDTFDDLVVLMSVRSNRTSAVADWVYVSFNGSTSNFSARVLDGSGSGASSESTFPRVFGYGSATDATTSTFGNSYGYIPNYRSSNNKSWSADGVSENNATTSFQTIAAGLWSNTAAITSITLTPRVGTLWVQHSTAVLYGIKKS